MHRFQLSVREQLRANGFAQLPSAPEGLLNALRSLALSRYLEGTGYAWDSTHRLRRRRREVIPAELPPELLADLCAWLHTLAAIPGLPDSFAQAFAAHDKLPEDLASAGFGYAPTNTGALAVHRDALDGVTVLIALDTVTTSNGAVRVYVGSHDFEPMGSDKNLPRQLRHQEYPSVPLIGDPGDVFCFNARTYHYGLGNRSTTGRIIFNAALGSSVPTCISTTRVLREAVPTKTKKRKRSN